MKIKKFDVVDFVDNDKAIIEYLNAALDEGDSDCLKQVITHLSQRETLGY